MAAKRPLANYSGTIKELATGDGLEGTWQGSPIASGYGGTGFTTYATGDIIYASGVNTLAKLAAGTDGQVLTLAGGVPTWAAGGGGVTYASEAEYITGTETNKALSPAVARDANIVLGTEVTLSNQTAVDFTGIPSWVKRITISFSGVGTNGASTPIIQLGDAGGIETSGYAGAASLIANVVSTALFINGLGLSSVHAAAVRFSGQAVFTKIGALRWAGTWVTGRNDAAGTNISGTSKVLSDTLTQVRVTTANGTDQYVTGVINILYE